MPPQVSVVMPVFNAGPYVGAAVRSVLDQDVPDMEVLCIDNGSTDDSARVLGAVSDSRVSVVSLAGSGTPSRPRNRGISLARGRFVAFMDADDVMLPGHLRRALDAYQLEPAAGLLFSDYTMVGSDGAGDGRSRLADYRRFQAAPKREIAPDTYRISRQDLYHALIHENFIGTPSVVVPKWALEAVGTFDEGLRNSEDRDLWFRLAAKFDALYLNRLGFQYRRVGGSVTQRRDPRIARHRIRVLRRQLKRELPPDLIRELHRAVAENYAEIGFIHKEAGRRRKAVRMFLAAWRESKEPRFVVRAAVAFLGLRRTLR